MRIVVKVGTSTLAHATGRLNIRHVEELVKVLSDLKNAGHELILVSSGAIGMGVGKLNLSGKPADMPTKQAAAAVGQCELMYTYDKLFAQYNHTVAQILLTGEDVDHEDRRQNFENTMFRLLELGALPVINENDTVATAEIKVGDNDTLGAIVACSVKADLLVLLSDIEGLYTADPRKNPEAELIPTVAEVTPEIEALAGGKGSDLATGGMETKLRAAKLVTAQGCDMVITNGEHPERLYDIVAGAPVGTRFLGGGTGMNREQMQALAQETLEISRAGRYTLGNRVIPLEEGRKTELWTSDALETLDTTCQVRASESAISQTITEVRGEGTVDAIFRLAGGERLCPQLGVLNFASAKNPGGGFLNGSVAQEECLAFCSNLYQTQTTGQGPQYYEINRANRNPVYTDTMLIGDVTFFRDSKYALTGSPVTCPVITAPAVNMGIVIRNGDSVERAKRVMKGRMEKILALFAKWGCTSLILGAYGCGVFRNNPEDVARFWQELLVEEHWGGLFERVVFSILERPGKDGNITPFRRRFG